MFISCLPLNSTIYSETVIHEQHSWQIFQNKIANTTAQNNGQDDRQFDAVWRWLSNGTKLLRIRLLSLSIISLI